MKVCSEFPFNPNIFRFGLKRSIDYYSVLDHYVILNSIDIPILQSTPFRITKRFGWHLKVHKITIRFLNDRVNRGRKLQKH